MPRLATAPVVARFTPHAVPSATRPSAGLSGAASAAFPSPLGHHLASFTVSAAGPIQCAIIPVTTPRRSQRKRKSPQMFRPPAVQHIRRPRRVGGILPNNYKLPGRIGGRLRQRGDWNRLKEHFEAIEQHFQTHQDVHSRSLRLGNKAKASNKSKLFRKHFNLAKTAKAKMTEAIGEMNATNKILKDRPRWTLKSGFGPGVGIDQIWKSPSGTINIVEAKGPGAKLGVSDRKGEQMSKSWVRQTAQGMGKDFGIVNAIDKKGGVNNVPKVRGFVIYSTPTGRQAEKNWDKLIYN